MVGVAVATEPMRGLLNAIGLGIARRYHAAFPETRRHLGRAGARQLIALSFTMNKPRQLLFGPDAQPLGSGEQRTSSVHQ